MVLVVPVLLAVVLGLALGGRLDGLAALRLQRVELIVVAFLLQVAAFPFTWLWWSTPDTLAAILWLVSFGLLAVVAWCNRRLAGLPIVAAGLLSNIVAVGVNGGSMPTTPAALEALGKGHVVANNSSFDTSPNLAWLVDRWAVPDWLPVGNVYSVGDLLIAIGIVVVVLAGMGVRAPRIGSRAQPADESLPSSG